jgi:hypothetical protein
MQLMSPSPVYANGGFHHPRPMANKNPLAIVRTTARNRRPRADSPPLLQRSNRPGVRDRSIGRWPAGLREACFPRRPGLPFSTGCRLHVFTCRRLRCSQCQTSTSPTTYRGPFRYWRTSSPMRCSEAERIAACPAGRERPYLLASIPTGAPDRRAAGRARTPSPERTPGAAASGSTCTPTPTSRRCPILHPSASCSGRRDGRQPSL